MANNTTMLGFDDCFLTYIRGAFPLISIDTIELDRATGEVRKLTEKWNASLPDSNAEAWLKTSGYDFYTWDCVNGLVGEKQGKKAPIPGTDSPVEALKKLLDNNLTRAGVYVFHNFHFQWADPLMLPILVQLVHDFYSVSKAVRKHIVFIGSGHNIPQEVQRLIVTLDFTLPTKEKLVEFITAYTEGMGCSFKKKDIEAAAIAAQGMTLEEVEGAILVSVVTSKGREIDRKIIFEEKARAVKRSGLLEYIHTDETMESVGGLTNMKAWFGKVAKAFRNKKEADEYGLPTPKGALVAGVSGTGKSLSGKAVAHLFGVPLFRCDIGKLFGGIVGDTERNTRELFKLIEAVSPCTILLDEIEKSLAGSSSSDYSDAGVTARLMSNILYWMEESTSPAFIMATANDVSKLPPELMRKGRFSEVSPIASFAA